MHIVCGTDFSEHAAPAVEAAAALAFRARATLHLVHALSRGALDDSAVQEMQGLKARSELASIAERLKGTGLAVEVSVRAGLPDEVLLTVAREQSPALIVVGALGQRGSRYKLGSHAGRLAQHTDAPLLVVRDEKPFEAWARGKRPLRILLGVGRSHSSERATNFVAALREFGPLEVIAHHIYWPPEEFQRLGLSGVRSWLDPDEKVNQVVIRELQRRLAAEPNLGPVSLEIEPHLGMAGARLAAVADERKVDLVVVGSRARSASERLWEGSISGAVLGGATMSVLCVPARSRPAESAAVPVIRTILAATDFSPAGDAAVRLACSLVEPGGTVHLAYVAVDKGRAALEPADIFESKRAPERNAEALAFRLTALVPASVAKPGRIQAHVLVSDDPAQAICQAAERLGVDLLCLGTRGHSGLAKMVLGSVTASVLGRTTRPVAIAHEPKPEANA
jgi:nucleotide-binding universal stress UspA family protein